MTRCELEELDQRNPLLNILPYPLFRSNWVTNNWSPKERNSRLRKGKLMNYRSVPPILVYVQVPSFMNCVSGIQQALLQLKCCFYFTNWDWLQKEGNSAGEDCHMKNATAFLCSKKQLERFSLPVTVDGRPIHFILPSH